MAGFINNFASGGMTKELLWSNSSPTSAYTFGSATISAANYGSFLIKYKLHKDDTPYFYAFSGKEIGALA